MTAGSIVEGEREGTCAMWPETHSGIDASLMTCPLSSPPLFDSTTFRAGDEGRPAAIAIDQNGEIQFFRNVCAFFQQETVYFAPLRAGLMRDQRFADQFLGESGNDALVLGELDAAGLAAPTGISAP